MEITYKGGNSLIIATKKTSLIIDPKVSHLGLKDPGLSDAVEIVTDERNAVEGARLQIASPGEFEIGDFSIRGIAARRSTDTEGFEAIVYRIETAEFRIGLLGNVEGKLTDEQLEEIGVVDILILPVGGNGFTLDPHDAATLTRQIDPKVVIPIHYEDAGLTYEVPQLPLDAFTRELNVPIETPDKYRPKNAAVLPEALSVVALARS